MPSRAVVDPRFPARLRELRTGRGWSLRELARLTYFGKSYLHDFETGARTPTREHAARLDEALGAGGELAGMVAGDDPLAYAAAHPGRADAAAVDRLADRLADARRLEDEVGAGPMLPTTAAELAVVGDLMRHARAPVRPRLVAVAAQWAQFAGWLHLAVGRMRRAGVMFDRSLEWALEVDDREMVATVLSFKGHAGWLAGDLGPMIGLTEAALRDPDVHVGQRAYDRYQLARGHAVTGARQPATEALAAGADLAAETVEYTGPRPPWHYYRSQAFFDLEAGLVHQLLGHHTRAAELLQRGLAGLPPEMRQAVVDRHVPHRAGAGVRSVLSGHHTAQHRRVSAVPVGCGAAGGVGARARHQLRRRPGARLVAGAAATCPVVDSPGTAASAGAPWLEDDHRRLGGPERRVRVQLRVDLAPPGPQR